jgi:hypothetical protein
MAARLAKHHVIAVPPSIEKELSPTSYAEDCFVNRKFSRNLQEFLVSYALTVTSPLVLSDESYTALEQRVKK